MSSKSSLRSHHSTASSMGQTSSSAFSAGSSSRRHRREMEQQELRTPPTTMAATERLQLIRNALSRLAYVCERQLHMAPLDQVQGSDGVTEFFERLRNKLPKLAYNPRKIGTPETGGPKQLQYIAKEVPSFRQAAEAAIKAIDTSVAASEAASVYAGLQRNHVFEAVRELEELEQLLAHSHDALPSRVNTELLADLVAFHINEFDAFAEQRVSAYVKETNNEGAIYSAGVMENASQQAKPIGITSVTILDVAIGVRPGRSARIVLEHAIQRITRIENRVHAADIVLSDLEGKLSDEKERLDQVNQQRLYAILKTRIQDGLSELTALRTKWEEAEAGFFNQAASPAHSLDALVQTKRFKEAEIIEAAQDIHDRLVHAALPFATPQYHRRYGETYAQPCHVRVGFQFMASPSTAAVMNLENTSASASSATPPSISLDTLNSQFLSLMAEHKVPVVDHAKYSYLVPSKEQVWISFEEFPEMVRGARCALRGVDTRLDHFRALEEQKEVGGYFVMRGGERILRALLMQRCNVAINIERDRFVMQGPNFSNKAVVIRSKRPSGLTVQNYFYYTTVGDIIFSFARKVVWHIPISLLLAATSTANASAAELYRLLTLGMPSGSHPARVEALLQHHRQKPYGELTNFLDFMTVLGRMYRQYHENSLTFRFLPQFVQGAACQHDAWYGLFMLRRHVLPHLNVDTPTPDLAPDATAEELVAWLTEPLRGELDRKFDALVAITRQLYQFCDGTLGHQGSDVPAYQELFTVSQALMAGFEMCLNSFFKRYVHQLGRHIPANLFDLILRLRQSPAHEAAETLRQVKEFVDLCGRRRVGDPLRPLFSLLVTGNLALDREADFYTPQTSGWVVMAEHLNFYRFFEQLRCVHRGKTIAGMRSSEVRKYPCESYGFICMVHSPDGEDCGVLNHLNVNTIMSNSFAAQSHGKETLRSWLEECLPQLRTCHPRRLSDAEVTVSATVRTAVEDQLIGTVPVWVEGELVGYVTPSEAQSAAAALRQRKAITDEKLVDANGVVRRHDATPLNTLEVVFVPPGNKDPKGLYLFYECGRLMRPVQKIESTRAATSSVKQLAFPLVFVGTWEQTWLDIASVPTDLMDGVMQLGKKYEFMEQNGSNLISLTSTTIPFFEYNCSPRNLFQCGLSKQSAGTQLQALGWRREAKLFRVYCPQRYISRTLPMDFYGLDDVNLGVNAVIAILAYTGYDLDDAVILNSTASQRGMLTAGITVGKVITASGSGGGPSDTFVFHNVLATGERFTPELGANGLPLKRANPELETSFNFTTDHKYPALHDNSDVYCCARRVERVDSLTNKRVYEYTQHHSTKWRHFDKGEDAWVHQVVPLAFDGPDPTSVLVIFRIPRPPTVGDKFSSRHGQKGTLPLHIRSHDLPFASASGITPDVIINPHAFPSRMTVGMVLEIMTGKVGAVEGRFIDNSAWSTVDDQPRVAEVIGDALVKSGYNRYGRERLVDGISGEEMEADVFMGVCGYQRLRHMVSDKWQARARTDAHTYRAVTKTGQPVKGRKRHGGVRVGEMERDGLLSHGMSEVVLDRLLHVSDKTKAFICPQCGSLLSIYERHATEYSTWKSCRFCGAGADENTDNIAMVEIPQVLRLWAAELTSIGVRVVMKTSELQQFS